MKERRNKESGFTLFEVMVASSIMAISAVVAMQVISLGLKNISKSREYSEMVLVAKREMEALLLRKELDEEMNMEFERGDFKVNHSIALAKNEIGSIEVEEKKQNPHFDMYEITVTVSNQKFMSKRDFTLSALKLGKKKAE